ncbi:Uncharacterized protein dnm_088850 [Desulfonema magnum]|uniref:Uncharacterized protein n=1 Tax=Desulfonema magnum TaxID=45655 RepID=A0A975BW30_9BACT|nr:Uncharacterized protein dnm_088850 [Desulfonema magnum]
MPKLSGDTPVIFNRGANPLKEISGIREADRTTVPPLRQLQKFFDKRKYISYLVVKKTGDE